MSEVVNLLDSELEQAIQQIKEDAQRAFSGLRAGGTLTANGTVGFVQRVPGRDILVSVNDPGLFRRDQALTASAVGLDGTVYLGKGGPGSGRYTKLFVQHPDITTVSHVHTPHLGAWAQTHRTLPIRYVPVQRFQLARELPIYIDRRQLEVDFILDRLAESEFHTAILEDNGGATVWGKQGLLKTAEFIQILEEGAQLQILAEAIGGSRDFGPGVLTQQWKMGGIYEKALGLGLIPPGDAKPAV